MNYRLFKILISLYLQYFAINIKKLIWFNKSNKVLLKGVNTVLGKSVKTRNGVPCFIPREEDTFCEWGLGGNE